MKSGDLSNAQPNALKRTKSPSIRQLFAKWPKNRFKFLPGVKRQNSHPAVRVVAGA